MLEFNTWKRSCVFVSYHLSFGADKKPEKWIKCVICRCHENSWDLEITFGWFLMNDCDLFWLNNHFEWMFSLIVVMKPVENLPWIMTVTNAIYENIRWEVFVTLRTIVITNNQMLCHNVNDIFFTSFTIFPSLNPKNSLSKRPHNVEKHDIKRSIFYNSILCLTLHSFPFTRRSNFNMIYALLFEFQMRKTQESVFFFAASLGWVGGRVLLWKSIRWWQRTSSSKNIYIKMWYSFALNIYKSASIASRYLPTFSRSCVSRLVANPA